MIMIFENCITIFKNCRGGVLNCYENNFTMLKIYKYIYFFFVPCFMRFTLMGWYTIPDSDHMGC